MPTIVQAPLNLNAWDQTHFKPVFQILERLYKPYQVNIITLKIRGSVISALKKFCISTHFEFQIFHLGMVSRMSAKLITLRNVM